MGSAPSGWLRVKALSTFQRTLEIWTCVFSFLFKRIGLDLKWTYWGKYSDVTRKARLCAQAVWLREGLLRLGCVRRRMPSLLRCWPVFPGPFC